MLGFRRKTLSIKYIWMNIPENNAKKTYIVIWYFARINSNVYEKNNLDKTCPYNGLEHDIYSLRNEGTILLMGEFNTKKPNSQVVLLSNDSNSNPLWLDEDIALSNIYQISSEYLGDNLFGSNPINLCSY